MHRDLLSLLIVANGLLSAIMVVLLGHVLLSPVYLPDKPERELRMARWRQMGGAVLILWFMGGLALFLRPPCNVLYVKLALLPTAPELVLLAMNQPLLTEARKAWQARRRAGTPKGGAGA